MIPAGDFRRIIRRLGQGGFPMSSPKDQVAKIFDAAVEFMQINFLAGYDVAQDRQRPAWKPGDFFGDLFGRGK